MVVIIINPLYDMEIPNPEIELAAIEISLEDTIKGVKLSPDTVDIPTLRLFLQEVEFLVKGEATGKPLDGSNVVIAEGSVKLKIAAAAWLISSFLGDMKKLAEGQDLDLIQPRRASIIQGWQKRAEKNPTRSYGIQTADGTAKILKIESNSGFHHKKDYAWTKVEKFIQGKVLDIGGKQSPNVHLSITGSKKEITVSASESQLSEERENRLYKEVLLRVNAEQNIITGDLKNVRLVEFVKFAEIDEDALKLAQENGKKAWGDIKSASDWIEEMRGH